MMRCAMVTGAGTGIGRAVAIRLARDGYAVVLAGRRLEPLQAVARDITASGGRALAMAADVTQFDQVETLVRQTVAAFGRIDVVVNNAGNARMAVLARLSVEQWHDILNANLSSAFYLTHTVWPIMQRQFEQAESGESERSGGVIVNISSMASKDPFPGLAAYGAAKAGLNTLTLATAREGHNVGIRAVCIAPAAVDTGMFKRVMGDRPIPEGIMLQPEDVAAMVADAVSGALRYCSGDTIFVHRKPS